jgi:DNA-binding NtrC family response regulator
MESDSRCMFSLLSDGMPVDLVFIDCRILDEDVGNILRYVKHVAPHVPVIVQSSGISIEKYLRIMSEGAYEYVNKPVADSEIVRIVNMAIGAPHTIRPLPRSNSMRIVKSA